MRVWIGVAVFVALAVAFAFVARTANDTGPEAGPRNVLVITLDTFRADAVGPDTPALIEFLATARRYAGARSVAPLTVPAHASLFSGFEPAVHGAHDNASALLRSRRAFPLLAEEFREAGYATGAVVAASVLDTHTGLDGGFETYDVLGRPELGYAPAAAIVERTRAWLAKPREKPYFLWVHLFDAHSPLQPYGGDARRAASRRGANYRDLYYGEVRRVDAAVEALLGLVDPEAIVVVVSDHGEGLGEHDEPTHGPLCYGTTIDLLLAVRAAECAPGTTDAAPRSICDLAPTLRRWCGLPAREADGKALDGPPRPVVVSESLQVWRIHGWGQVLAAFDGRFSLVESGPAVELFDRHEDPGETQPLELAGHAAYERLDRALAAYRARGSDEPAYMPVAITPYGSGRRPGQTYLTRPENARKADPRTRLAFWSKVASAEQGAKLARQRRDVEALHALLDQLDALAREEPANPAPHWARAEVLRAMAELTANPTWRRDAAAATRAAIDRGYLSAAILEKLLEDSREGGDREDMKRAVALAADEGIVPDLALAAAVAQTCRLLAAYGETDALADGRALLARARRYHPDAAERLDRLSALLE